LQCAFLAASEEEEAKRANTERQRLAEMEPAQTARAKALADAEAALRREAEAQAARARSCRIIQWGGALAALRPFVTEPWHQLYNAHLKQRERAVLEGHRGTVLSAVFAPDGTLILTSSADNTARLWDGDGKPLATLEGHRRGQERGVRARWQAHPYHLGRLYGAAVGWRPQAARHPGRPPARDR